MDHATDYDLLSSAGGSGDVTFLGVTKQSISVNKKKKKKNRRPNEGTF